MEPHCHNYRFIHEQHISLAQFDIYILDVWLTKMRIIIMDIVDNPILLLAATDPSGIIDIDYYYYTSSSSSCLHTSLFHYYNRVSHYSSID